MSYSVVLLFIFPVQNWKLSTFFLWINMTKTKDFGKNCDHIIWPFEFLNINDLTALLQKRESEIINVWWQARPFWLSLKQKLPVSYNF